MRGYTENAKANRMNTSTGGRLRNSDLKEATHETDLRTAGLVRRAGNAEYGIRQVVRRSTTPLQRSATPVPTFRAGLAGGLPRGPRGCNSLSEYMNKVQRDVLDHDPKAEAAASRRRGRVGKASGKFSAAIDSRRARDRRTGCLNVKQNFLG